MRGPGALRGLPARWPLPFHAIARPTSVRLGFGRVSGPNLPRNSPRRRRFPHSAPRPVISHEREGRHGPGRLTEPRSHRAPLHREPVPEHRPVQRQAAPVHRRVRHDHPHAHRHGDPPSLPNDLGGEPSVAVHLGHECSGVRDLRLEFHDEQRAPDRMPCQEIDGTALSVHGERDLGAANPPWRSFTTRSASPPRHSGANGSRISSASATARSSTRRNSTRRPRSARDTWDRETAAAWATSV